MVSWVILGFAIGFFLVGFGGFLLSMWRATAGQRNALMVLVGLLLALGAALVIFSFFPTSEADGELWGFALTGAGAFVFILWLGWIRFTRSALTQDQFEARIDSLEQQLEAARARQRRQALPHKRFLYELAKSSKTIGLVTGDLAKVRFVDIWVNSENTRMQMSRIDEPTISATIRYHGAGLDGVGDVDEDYIADELKQRMKSLGKSSVALGHVMVTGPGALAQTHEVMAVFHVAAVQGEPKHGYKQVKDVEKCVTDALELAEGVEREGKQAQSIIFPLLGTGVGEGDLAATSKRLLDAAIEYLLDDQHESNLETVWFVAYDAASLECCQAALKGRAAEER